MQKVVDDITRYKSPHERQVIDRRGITEQKEKSHGEWNTCTGWHHEARGVARRVMVDAVRIEIYRLKDFIGLRNVEDKAVEKILDECPE